MKRHLSILVTGLACAVTALADGTGPTFPERSRDHPLDNREPRQDVIEGRDARGEPPAVEEAGGTLPRSEEPFRLPRPEAPDPTRDDDP